MDIETGDTGWASWNNRGRNWSEAAINQGWPGVPRS